MAGIERLQRHEVDFNVLVAVSSANVENPHELYRFLSSLGIRYQQYVPIVELDQKGQPHPYSVNSEQWAGFLIGLFDSWLPDAERTSIRFFDAILHKLILDLSLVCTMSTNCCHYFVVEHNGDIFPCDFFVEKAWKIGNINENNWDQLVHSPLYKRFGQQKANWSVHCAACAYLSLCGGDCMKHRLGASALPGSLSWLCSGYKRFFDHALPGFQRLARRIKRRQSQELIHGSAL